MKVTRLVKEAKKGNKEALLELIMDQKDDYYKLAFTYVGNEHDAMDAMEEMIVILYDNVQQLKNEEVFYSWSKTILVNCCKRLVKKRNKVLLVEEWVEEQSFTEDPFKKSEDQIEIEQLLQLVNEHQKEAIQLRYYHDLDYQMIAEITQVSIGTVKSRIFQGLKKLRDHYRGDGDE